MLRGEPLRAELKAFVAAIRDGSDPSPGIEDGIRALDVALSARRFGYTRLAA